MLRLTNDALNNMLTNSGVPGVVDERNRFREQSQHYTYIL